MIGERNKSRIKKMSKQYSIKEFADEIFAWSFPKTNKSPTLKISFMDLFSKKKLNDKIENYKEAVAINAKIEQYNACKDSLMSGINLIIDYDD